MSNSQTALEVWNAWWSGKADFGDVAKRLVQEALEREAAVSATNADAKDETCGCGHQRHVGRCRELRQVEKFALCQCVGFDRAKDDTTKGSEQAALVALERDAKAPIPAWVVTGLFRAAESKEQREGTPLWDDECRRALEWMRANVAEHAGIANTHEAVLHVFYNEEAAAWCVATDPADAHATYLQGIAPSETYAAKWILIPDDQEVTLDARTHTARDWVTQNKRGFLASEYD